MSLPFSKEISDLETHVLLDHTRHVDIDQRFLRLENLIKLLIVAQIITWGAAELMPFVTRLL